MTQATLDFIEHKTSDNPTHAIIWLHGLGADGNDFVPMVEAIQLPAHASLHFIFPHAPAMPVTLNGGMVMPAWYDIYSLDREAKQDAAGIKKSAAQIEQLIDYLMAAGYKSEQIFIAGFSQGGAMALYTGLCYPKRLAGIIALSCYLPIADEFEKNRSEANNNTPIFLAAGEIDPVVPIHFSRQSKRKLLSLNYQIAWHHYPMEHQVCPQEVADLQAWLEKQI